MQFSTSTPNFSGSTDPPPSGPTFSSLWDTFVAVASYSTTSLQNGTKNDHETWFTICKFDGRAKQTIQTTTIALHHLQHIPTPAIGWRSKFSPTKTNRTLARRREVSPCLVLGTVNLLLLVLVRVLIARQATIDDLLVVVGVVAAASRVFHVNQSRTVNNCNAY